MSVWTDVNGKHNSKKVSARKLISSVLDGSEYVFSNTNNQEFKFSLEGYGIYNAKQVQKIVEKFHELDKKAWIELEVRILFY